MHVYKWKDMYIILIIFKMGINDYSNIIHNGPKQKLTVDSLAYIYICVCVCVCVCVQTYICNFVHTYICIYIWICTMQETRARSLGQADPLEKEMATHSSILAWRIPWMEKPGRLQSMRSQRVGHDWATSLSFFHFLHVYAYAASLVAQQ